MFSSYLTNTSGQQPTDKNLELSSAFAEIFEGGADKEPPIVISYLNVNDARFRLGSKGFTLSLIGYTSTCENSCTSFFFTCENEAYRFLQMSFVELNSRVMCNNDHTARLCSKKN